MALLESRSQALSSQLPAYEDVEAKLLGVRDALAEWLSDLTSLERQTVEKTSAAYVFQGDERLSLDLLSRRVSRDLSPGGMRRRRKGCFRRVSFRVSFRGPLSGERRRDHAAGLRARAGVRAPRGGRARARFLGGAPLVDAFGGAQTGGRPLSLSLSLFVSCVCVCETDASQLKCVLRLVSSLVKCVLRRVFFVAQRRRRERVTIPLVFETGRDECRGEDDRWIERFARVLWEFQDTILRPNRTVHDRVPRR